MKKHTDNVVAATSEVHGDEFFPNRVDAPPAQEEPKRGGENITQTPIRRRPAGGKRKTVLADVSQATGQKAAARSQTKTEIVLRKLRSAKGVTIVQLGEATGWQAHSVRGFLSAVVRKKPGLTLVSKIGKDGVRRYRAEGGADGAVTNRTG